MQREHVGVDNYLKHLVLALGGLDRKIEYRLFVNVEDRRLFAEALPSNFSIVPTATRARATRLLHQQAGLPALSRALSLDVVHSPALVMPTVRGAARHLLTIHDLTQFSIPQAHTRLRRSRFFRSAMQMSIRRADLVVVPSEHVRSEVLERFDVAE
jgi:hypothetical protein